MSLDLNQYNIESINKSILPTFKDENWKYTKLDSCFENGYKAISIADSIVKVDQNTDDHYQIDISESGIKYNTPAELKINLRTDTAYTNTPFSDDFATYIGKANTKTNIEFIMESDTSLSKPVFISYSFSSQNGFFNLHTSFNIGKNSKLELLEDFSSSKACFVSYHSKPQLADNANFNHTIIQDMNYESLFINSYDAVVLKDANLFSSIINLGAKISRSNIYINLRDENATCHAHGLYALDKNQHHDTSSYIHHSKAHTFSHQLYKGIMNGESRGVFTGKVRVEKDAQLINAEQLNKNLLLSDKARVNSRPQLEIYADDVKCAHGSTTGQISDDELFYFESRGIPKDKARSILARAFAYDVVLKQQNLFIRSTVIKYLIQKNIVGAQ